MQEYDSFPIDGIKVDKLTVEPYPPNWNDLSWQVFSVILSPLEFDNPGDDEVIARLFSCLISNPRVFRPGTIYANPCGVVRSPQPNKRFFQYARQVQQEWFGRLKDILYSANRVKLAMKQHHPIIRQLIHTGVMIIANRHVFPNKWPDRLGQSKPHGCQPRVNIGERFGALVVLKALPKGQLECRCDCDNIVVKHRKHLVSGATTSCGCRKAQLEERLKNRRRDRGWKHTGELQS
jgi:hypothetical protein